MKDGSLKEYGTSRSNDKNSKMRPPFIIYLDISSDCSCPKSCLDKKRTIMKPEELKEVLRSVNEAGVKAVICKGDLYAVKYEIWNIIAYAKNIGIDIYFLNKDKVTKIADWKRSRPYRRSSFYVSAKTTAHLQEKEMITGSSSCGAGLTTCHISSCGIVTPCSRLPLKCGDARMTNFLDIWNNSELMRQFRNLSSLPICNGCEFLA